MNKPRIIPSILCIAALLFGACSSLVSVAPGNVTGNNTTASSNSTLQLNTTEVTMICDSVQLAVSTGVTLAIANDPSLKPYFIDAATALQLAVNQKVTDPTAIASQISGALPANYSSIVTSVLNEALSTYSSFYNNNASKLTSDQPFLFDILGALSTGLNSATGGAAIAAASPNAVPLSQLTTADLTLH
jgi:hypothetical protein